MTLLTKSQIMEYVISGRARETFDDSIEGKFDVTSMRELAAKLRMPTKTFPMSGIAEYLTNQRVIDQARVRELQNESFLYDPVLVVEYPATDSTGAPSHLLIDGAHRLSRRWRNRFSTFQAYVFTPDQIIRPDMTNHRSGEELGIDWGGKLDGDKIINRT